MNCLRSYSQISFSFLFFIYNKMLLFILFFFKTKSYVFVNVTNEVHTHKGQQNNIIHSQVVWFFMYEHTQIYNTSLVMTYIGIDVFFWTFNPFLLDVTKKILLLFITCIQIWGYLVFGWWLITYSDQYSLL